MTENTDTVTFDVEVHSSHIDPFAVSERHVLMIKKKEKEITNCMFSQLKRTRSHMKFPLWTDALDDMVDKFMRL